jgi:peroxiredoxin
MKSLLAFLAATFLVTASPVIADAQTDPRGFIVSVGDMMPNFELADLDGQVHTHESLLGKVYVLQFTASWCSVCRAEMPHLETEVWQVFQDRDFMLLGVDLDEPREKVAQFTQQMGVSYPMCPDSEGKVFYSIAAPKSGVTRNVVVDQEGRIAMLTRLFDKEEFARMVKTIDVLTSAE